MHPKVASFFRLRTWNLQQYPQLAIPNVESKETRSPTASDSYSLRDQTEIQKNNTKESALKW